MRQNEQYSASAENPAVITESSCIPAPRVTIVHLPTDPVLHLEGSVQLMSQMQQMGHDVRLLERVPDDMQGYLSGIENSHDAVVPVSLYTNCF